MILYVKLKGAYCYTIGNILSLTNSNYHDMLIKETIFVPITFAKEYIYEC